jgi:hypothetical protein
MRGLTPYGSVLNMNDNITISTFQLFQMFPDKETEAPHPEPARQFRHRYREQTAYLQGVDPMKRAPRILNKIVDVVLAYHPKPKSKKGQEAQRKRRKHAKRIS